MAAPVDLDGPDRMAELHRFRPLEQAGVQVDAVSSPVNRYGHGLDPPDPARRPAGLMDAVTTTVVEIYTDGACSGNPGPGGWGALLRYGGVEKELCGGEATPTTNNRMELTAPIRALESLTRPVVVHIYTDSSYVRIGIMSWVPKWKRNGWQTAGRQPVKNVDLWTALDEAAARHQVEWHWVKGHAGHPENERADRLAARGMQQARAATQR